MSPDPSGDFVLHTSNRLNFWNGSYKSQGRSEITSRHLKHDSYWNKKYNSDEMWDWVAGLLDTKQITLLDVIN